MLALFFIGLLPITLGLFLKWLFKPSRELAEAEALAFKQHPRNEPDPVKRTMCPIFEADAQALADGNNPMNYIAWGLIILGSIMMLPQIICWIGERMHWW